MPESASHSPQVDAGGQELGGVVVAELVERGDDAEPVDHALVFLGDRVGKVRRAAVGLAGEEESVARDPDGELGRVGVLMGDVVLE